jgi:aryl sulfotransferase
VHTYQNHLLDSTRWHHFVPRDDDIIITTSYKAGTTWTQAIVAHLILGTQAIPALWEVSPWIEARGDAIEAIMAKLDMQQHRRFMKTHLPLDGLPFHEQVKYIVVGRDARDVFMSLWNHHTSHHDALVSAINEWPGRIGAPLPGPQQEIHAFWRNWITRGWFEWESEGYPYWGNLHHTKTWWHHRILDNILFVHFNDLLSDVRGEIRRIARFLEIACSDQTIADVAHMVTFSTMKHNAGQLLPDGENVWKGGAQSFIFKGTNGRWKDVLSPAELALHTEAVARVLTPECAGWLEHGRSALRVAGSPETT